MTDTTTATPSPDTTPALPTEPAAIAARDAELTELAERDPPTYHYSDNGKLATEHLAIRKALQETGDHDEAEQLEGDDLADADDIDLDAETDDAGDGEEPAEGDEAEQPEEREPLKPWQPPEGQEIAEYAKPHLEELDGIASDEGQRDKIIGLYQRVAEAQTTRLANLNKTSRAEMVAGLKSELGDDFSAYRDQVDAAFNALSKQDRAELKNTRLADGRLLLNTRVGIDLLHRLGAKAAAAEQPQDRRTMLQQEIAEIDGAMHQDAASLYRPYKNTGMSASDYKQNALREIASPAPKPSAAALKSEEAELLALHQSDPSVFEYSPTWKRTKKTAAQRLYEIRTGRA